MGGSGKRVKDPEKEKAKAAKKEAEEQKKVAKKPEERVAPFSVIRVSGTDLNGEKPLVRAIMGIKGIGWVMSNAICEAGCFDPNQKLKDIGEENVKKIEQIIKDPVKFGIPNYLVNRRRDLETGSDVHLTGADLAVATKFDIQKYVDLKTYRGWRHMLGQPVRGQRTRSKFREKGRVVGVLRKAVKLAAREKEEEKK